MLRIPKSAKATTISPVISKPMRAFGRREPGDGIGLTISILLTTLIF